MEPTSRKNAFARRRAGVRGVTFYGSAASIVVILGVMLLQSRVEVTAPGEVTGEELRIAAPHTGRLVKLRFGSHEPFETDALMAELENPEVESLANALESEIRSLEKLVSEIAHRPGPNPARDLMRDLEGYRLDLSQARGRLDVAELAIVQASAAVDIKRKALQRCEKLVVQAAQTSYQRQARRNELRLAELEYRSAQLEREVEADRIRQIEGVVARTEAAIAGNQHTAPDTISLRARLEEKRTQLHEVQSKLAGLAVRAVGQGIIVRCLKSEGELVAEGETITAVGSVASRLGWRLIPEPSVASSLPGAAPRRSSCPLETAGTASSLANK